MATRTPRTPRKTRQDAEQRQAIAQALRDRLDQWQDEADPAMIAAALARHDGYSERNAMLIAMQDEEATMVRGYVAWMEVGRQVGRLPDDAPPIAILSYRGEFKAKPDAAAKPDPAAKADPAAPGGEVKPSKRFSPCAVYDIRWTFPLTCGHEEDGVRCGLPIHRTGMETKEQMQARDGRRQAALWAHTGKPDAGHKASRPYDPDAAPMAPQVPDPATLEQIKAAEAAAAALDLADVEDPDEMSEL